ncbi:MAG TPA: bifunctional diguanylate cyclase/phosphodiesterase [Steroidobacteraceae bacterium]|nr:bifunctional diguanylate cyclase/phosphodiesterase [Steroidobacteraceae bacterium]
MKRRGRATGSGWLLTVAVLAVVTGAGSRLIYLSVQHHEALARERAAGLAAGFVGKIEPRLAALARLARRQQQLRADQSPDSGGPGPWPLTPGAFWLGADGQVIAVRDAEAGLAASIAGEWAALASGPAAVQPSVLGPIRQGSDWLVAVRVPAAKPAASAAARPEEWSVAYANLNALIAPAHLGRLVDMGYDFELAQIEPRSARSRSFVTSERQPVSDAVAATIRLPAGLIPAIPGSYLQLALRPHEGWYAPTRLASQIGLLAFLAWLFAFGVHDLSHALQRAQARLAGARKRLHSANQELAREVQQRLSLQETFEHARFHDAFTGLPNRRCFMDQLDRALRDLRTRRRQRIAVVLVGVSRFKVISDMLGHTAGDELMVQAARDFEGPATAFGGVLARWSEDQLAILLPEAPSTEAVLKLAAELRQKLQSPFELRRKRLLVSATIGVTFAESGQQRVEDVMREADLALTVAARQQENKIVVYTPNMAGQAATLVSLEADLHIALQKHELQLLFQPIVELRTRRMIGAEALLRWYHPVEGVLTPEKFLGIAEDAGLMGPIARWVILRVCRLALDWRQRLTADRPFFISINLSPATLRDPGLGDYIAHCIDQLELPASLLKFELTEAALINNVAAARETLDKLHGMGLQLMLDDFGTGYSSLSHLQLFPFDFVKIDRPLVTRTGPDQATTGLTAAMVQMARSLRLTAIAEVIESEAVASALQAMGCEYGQGYYFSKPLEAPAAFHRLWSQQPFEPAALSAETVEVRPLAEDDDSPTIMIPADSISFQDR